MLGIYEPPVKNLTEFAATKIGSWFLLSLVWKPNYYWGLQYDSRKPSPKWLYVNLCSFMSYNQTNLSSVQNRNLYWPYFNKQENIFKLFDNFETSLSDHYMLMLTIMKSGNFKRPPKKKCIDHIKTLIWMSSIILWIRSFISLKTIIQIHCSRKDSSLF